MSDTSITPDNVVDKMIALALAGFTRAAIAAQVGMTRSQVCGHLWRRKIAPAPKPAKVRAKPIASHAGKRAPRSTQPNGRYVTSIDGRNVPFIETVPGGVAWSDLESHQCHWPIDGGYWCGEAKAVQSYCQHHHRLAYRRAA